MSTALRCTADYSLFILKPDIPADKLSEALQHPDAIRLAYNLGTLEVISIALTVLGVVIAIAALSGGWILRREVIDASKKAAAHEIPAEVLAYMRINGNAVIGECLKDPELIATLQIYLNRLGLTGTDTATEVDTDADRKETRNDRNHG